MSKQKLIIDAVHLALDNLTANVSDPEYTIRDAAEYAVLDIMEITNMSDEDEVRESIAISEQVATLLHQMDFKV